MDVVERRDLNSEVDDGAGGATGLTGWSAPGLACRERRRHAGGIGERTQGSSWAGRLACWTRGNLGSRECGGAVRCGAVVLVVNRDVDVDVDVDDDGKWPPLF